MGTSLKVAKMVLWVSGPAKLAQEVHNRDIVQQRLWVPRTIQTQRTYYSTPRAGLLALSILITRGHSNGLSQYACGLLSSH